MSTTSTVERAVPILPYGLAIAGSALLANVIVYVIAALTQTPLAADQGAGPMTVPLLMVVIVSVVPILLGTGLTWLIARRSTRALSVMAWVGLAFALISAAAPIVSGVGGAKGFLACMHILPGLIWWAVLQNAARRAR